MRNRTALKRILFLCFVLGCLIFGIRAEKATAGNAKIVLQNESDETMLSPSMQLLEDQNGNLTIQDVTSTPFKDRFSPAKGNIPYLGFKHSVFWARVELENQSSKESWILQYEDVGFYFVDQLRVFLQQADSSQIIELENRTQQAISGHRRSYSLTLPQQSYLTLYFRIQGEALTHIKLSLEASNKADSGLDLYFVLLIAVLGSGLGFLLYNSLLYFSIRDRSLLFYILVLASMMAIILLNSYGILQHLFPNSSYWLINRINWLFFPLHGFCVLLFTREFLQLSKYSPIRNQNLSFLGLIFLIWIPILFLVPYHFVAKAWHWLEMMLFATVFFSAAMSWRQRVSGARYYIVSSFFVFLAVATWDLLALNLIPPVLPHIGIFFFLARLIEMSLLSLALVERFNKEREGIVDRIQMVNRLKDDFLANTSHELRTPLHGMIGLSQSLLSRNQQNLSKQDQQELQAIVQSGKRLSLLINDIQDFSILKQGDLQLNLRPVDLATICQISVSLCNTLVGQKKLVIEQQIPADFPFVMADDNRLQQIFLNLIGNAVKFTHQGSITIKAEIDNGFARVSIQDTGIGISANDQYSIFDSYEQVESPHRKEYGGTGLGLAITKRLVLLQGGNITVDSVEGKGSTFTFTLPLAQDPVSVGRIPLTADTILPVVPQQQSVQQDDALSVSYQLMVVDDEPINLQVLKNHLESRGYQVSAFQDGIQALESLKTNKPDLIMLDLMMPRINGYELCLKIRELYNPSEVPVIILTARVGTQGVIKGFESGANDYLTKPVDRDELLARVRTHLKMKQLGDLLRQNDDLKLEVARRKMAENNLMIAQRRLVRLLDASDDAIIMVNGDALILFSNQSAETYFGYSMDQLVNQPLTRLLPDPPRLSPADTTTFGSVISSQTSPLKGEFVPVSVKTADSTEISLLMLVTPLKLKDEQVTALIFKPSDTDLTQISLNDYGDMTPGTEVVAELQQHRNKVQAMQSAFDGVLDFLSQGGRELMSELRDINSSLDKTIVELTKEEQQLLFRKTLVDITTQALEIWKDMTNKGKVELAEESKIWTVYLNQGTYQTRTYDKYLTLSRLPANPRWKDVEQTARFVLQTCTGSHPLKNTLQTTLATLAALTKVL